MAVCWAEGASDTGEAVDATGIAQGRYGDKTLMIILPPEGECEVEDRVVVVVRVGDV